MVGGGHNHQHGGTFDVVLQRDAVTKPWGFRLQGGRESQQPLTIQRVFVGSASDGRLQRGDIITAVEGQDAFRMYHHDAESIIQNARNMLTLTVQRGSAISYAESAASDPGYYKASGTWPSGGAADGDELEDYSRTVSDIRQKFNSPPARASQKAGVIHMNPKPGMPSYVPKRPAIWTKKEPMAGTLAEMGWAPHLTPSRQQSAPSGRGGRQQYPGGVYYGGPTTPPVNRAPRHITPPSAQASKEHHEPPAWAGSLRRSGGVRLWELEDGEALARGGAPVGGRRHSPPRATGFVPHPAPSQGGDHAVTPHNPRLQTVRYGPGSSGPTYEQHDAANRSDSAHIAHLQYNSPIGLYSRQNAQEALTAQTGGKAGQGTMQISGGGGVPPYNPAQSDVFRLVAEEDEHRAMRQHGPAKVANNTRQQQQQRHHADGHQQHPPQHQQPYGGVESQFADMGISDF